MLFKRNHIFSALSVLILAVTFLYSCSPVDLEFDPTPSPGRSEESETIRIPGKEYRNVFIMYSMGFNDLRGYLAEDIRDVLSSPLSDNGRDIILIMSHIAEPFPKWPYFDPSIPVKPTLTKVSKNLDGSIRKDTLTVAGENLILNESTVLTSAETFRNTLEYIRANFDAERYGILLSSHGSGWAPSGYISDPDVFEGLIPKDLQRRRIPAFRLQREDEIPVKTIGVHYYTVNSSEEMEITDMADAFPFKMDYIIFDACFMGGIEVAYELRNVTDRIMFSQAEILADGMDYKRISSYIFAENGPDLEGFCQRYYDHYNSLSGQSKSATISLIDCSKLEALARTTGEMIEKYRSGLETLQNEKRSTVQRYYQSKNQEKQQWFYDFGDIIEKCGLTEEDKQIFNESLSAAVTYKAATPWFLSDFAIRKHSGMSMYLPFTQKRDYLNNFYKTLEWNQAVGLVQ